MKIKLLTLSLFVFSTLFSFAQKEANIWYFGEYAGLDFNSGSPVPLSNGQMSTVEGCASIADKTTGQQLFYTDGTSVWDRTGNIMTGSLPGLLGNYSSTQSAIIVPMPGSSTLYYIFTTDAQAGSPFGPSTTGYGGAAYSIVDMTLNGGLGDVSMLNTPLITPSCEKVSAVRHCNGHDIWVVTHQWSSNTFYAYLLSNSGLSTPVISNSGVVPQDLGSGTNSEAIGYLKFSPNGKKLAIAHFNDLNTLQVLDFDNATGILSNPITDANFPDITGEDGPYGISFSPDNSRLYVGAGDISFGGFSYVYQYNMLAGSSAAILASKTTVLADPTDVLGALQIGADGKIYVAKVTSFGGSSYLDVINSPNALGVACNYVSDGLYLGGSGLSDFGLPDMVESYIASPYTASLNYITCTGTNTLTFNDTVLNGTINLLWNFGDPSSGASNTSTQQTPTHTFSSSGPYTVTLYISNACKTDTFIQTIVTGGSLSVSAGPDTNVCSGNFVQLQANGGTTYNWSPSTWLTDSTIADPIAIPLATTTYTVTATSGGCSSTKTVTVNVFPTPPTPVITKSNDTLYCSFDPSYATYQWYEDTTLIHGATGTFIIITQSGNYNISVTNANGCSIAVGINVILNGIPTLLIEDGAWVRLSPNPVVDHFTISGLQFINGAELNIYNVLGEKVYSRLFESTNSKTETSVDVSRLADGIYIIQMNSGNRVYRAKVLKQ